MAAAYWLVMICGVLAVAYGVYAIRAVLSASAGNERMQEIALAIQEGANAYLNRQYSTIAVVGIIIGVILGFRAELVCDNRLFYRGRSVRRHRIYRDERVGAG